MWWVVESYNTLGGSCARKGFKSVVAAESACPGIQQAKSWFLSRAAFSNRPRPESLNWSARPCLQNISEIRLSWNRESVPQTAGANLFELETLRPVALAGRPM